MEKGSSKMRSVLLLLAMSTHSFFEGIALGAQQVSFLTVFTYTEKKLGQLWAVSSITCIYNATRGFHWKWIHPRIYIIILGSLCFRLRFKSSTSAFSINHFLGNILIVPFVSQYSVWNVCDDTCNSNFLVFIQFYSPNFISLVRLRMSPIL